LFVSEHSQVRNLDCPAAANAIVSLYTMRNVMKNMALATLVSVLVLPLVPHSAVAGNQAQSARATIIGCKPGGRVGVYQRSSSLRPYARLACGSTVHVWTATKKMALIQQGSAVAYVQPRHISAAYSGAREIHPALRMFLQALADDLPYGVAATDARVELARSCLQTRGCHLEVWADLLWSSVKQPQQLSVYPENSTLRMFAGGTYYSAFIIPQSVQFKGQPLPNQGAPTFIFDGGGLSLAIVNGSHYSLGADGQWYAISGEMGQSAVAMQ
jgi:hypothetical protein